MIAMLYSFFATCKAADVNLQACMKDNLNRIGNHPIIKLTWLLHNNLQKLYNMCLDRWIGMDHQVLVL